MERKDQFSHSANEEGEEKGDQMVTSQHTM
jgi:hypothetical protein